MGLETISTDKKEWESDNEPLPSEEERELRSGWEKGRDTFVVNGKTVEFYGLSHTIDTMRLYRKEIEDAIQGASCVFSEATPILYSENSPLQLDLLPLFLPEQREDIRRMTYFFNEIHHICRDNSRRVYTSDPLMSGRLADIVEKRSSLREFEVAREMDRLQVVLGSIAGILVGTDVEDPKDGKVDQPKEQQKKRGLTRRDLLKGVLAGTAISSMNGTLGKVLSSQGSDEFDRTDILGFNVHSFRDYRDICIAKGLDLLTKNIQSDAPVVAIYGADHTAPVKYYLGHPKERELRFKMYESTREKVPTALLGYEIDENGTWKITEELKYERDAPSFISHKK